MIFMEENKVIATLEEEVKRLSGCLFEINSFFERQVLHDIDLEDDGFLQAYKKANMILRHMFKTHDVRWFEIEEISSIENEEQ